MGHPQFVPIEESEQQILRPAYPIDD